VVFFDCWVAGLKRDVFGALLWLEGGLGLHLALAFHRAKVADDGTLLPSGSVLFAETLWTIMWVSPYWPGPSRFAQSN
jgi:hypothetical protein